MIDNQLIFTVVAIFSLLILAEGLWWLRVIRNEASRKLVHIGIGVFAGTWSFYLTDNQIYILALAMFIVVATSKFLNIFKSIHSVTRKTWGELFFPIGIAAAAYLTVSPWLMLAAMLHVGLADGFAALIGRRYARTHAYRVFNQEKTIVGTLVFYNISIAVTTFALLATGFDGGIIVLLLVPLLATAAENFGIYGSDDLLVPVFVAGLMSYF